jgi:hypothetical protein
VAFAGDMRITLIIQPLLHCDAPRDIGWTAELIWPASVVSRKRTGMTTESMTKLNSCMIDTWNAGKSKYIQTAEYLRDFEMQDARKGVHPERHGWLGRIRELEHLLPKNEYLTEISIRSSDMFRLSRIDEMSGGQCGFLFIHVLRNAPLIALICIMVDKPISWLIENAKLIGISIMEALNLHNVQHEEHRIYVLQIPDWAGLDVQGKVDFLNGVSSQYSPRLSIERVEAIQLPPDFV